MNTRTINIIEPQRTLEVQSAHPETHLVHLLVLEDHFPRSVRDGERRCTHQQLSPMIQGTQLDLRVIQVLGLQQRHDVLHNAQQQGIPGAGEDCPVEEELVVKQGGHYGVWVRGNGGEEALRGGVIGQRKVRGVAAVVEVVGFLAQQELVCGQHHVIEFGADVRVVVHVHACEWW